MNSTKRLKILFIAALYPSPANPARAIFIKEHAKAAALYNDIRVIAFDDSSKTIQGLYNVAESTEDGIRTFRIQTKRLPIPKTKRFLRWWALMKLFGKMRNEGYAPDAIHAHIFSAGPPAVILGKRYKIPVIITEHMSAFPRRTLSPFKKMMARFAMNRAKVILPVSENLKKHIQYYCINNNFCVVPNTVNTGIFYPSAEPNPGNDEPIKILTVVLLAPIKGIPNLLEALHGMRQNRHDFILDIVGDGPMRAEYEKMSASFKLDKFVTFHGMKSKQEVANFMRGCDFFVLPSHWETFGVVLTESMACGKPVIATNVGAVNEIVSETVGLLIPPSDSDALRKGIEFMVDNYRNYTADKIATYARKKFGYDSVGYMLDRIYKKHSQAEAI